LDRFKAPLFFLDAVSARKASRAASRIASFDTLKLGSMEAAALSGVKLSDNESNNGDTDALRLELPVMLEETADWFLDRGVRRIFITLGKNGVYTASQAGHFFTPVRRLEPVNTSGGGDAFTAGIVFGTLQGWDEEAIVSFSIAMAGITIQSKHTVCPEMSLELVIKKLGVKNEK